TYHIFIGDKSYWGKGVAKEASRQIISYGFQVLNLSSISLRVRPENVSAVNLYKSLGFKEVDRDERFIKMVI
ncbi:MAG: GNAT family N-acetyltransferase, partial [Clostridia bacterium]|nr:GNAT family N-acetyltransferase [Clostridia bacterium]